MTITSSQLLRFSRRFEQFYAKQFAPMLERTGLSIREIHVLLFLANNPEYDTARDVTEFRGLGKSQVSQAVELLAARGLLLRTPDKEDRRVVRLAITSRGAPLAREAQEIQSACGRELLTGLTAPERAAFLALLEKVFAGADRLMEGDGRI